MTSRSISRLSIVNYIDIFLPPRLEENILITRILYLIKDRIINPLLPWFLAVYCVIVYILYLSVASEYINYILWDMDKYSIRSDSLTEPDRLVKLRLDD